MKKVNITLTFDDDKLDALEFSLRKEHSSVQARMDDALKQLYEQKYRKLCGSIWTARLPLRPSPSAHQIRCARSERSPRQPNEGGQLIWHNRKKSFCGWTGVGKMLLKASQG